MKYCKIVELAILHAEFRKKKKRNYTPENQKIDLTLMKFTKSMTQETLKNAMLTSPYLTMHVLCYTDGSEGP